MAGRDAQAGFLTVQHVLAVALSLVLFTALANLVVFQYARGATRSVLDEAARAGARTAGTAEQQIAACRERAIAARDGLLAGRLRDSVVVGCRVLDDRVEAVANFRFGGWLPLVPDWTGQVIAVAAREPEA